MALGFVEQRQAQAESDDAVVVSRGFITTLRCANPDCNQAVAQAHTLGLAVFRVLCCPACFRASEFEATPQGWTVKLLPKRAAVLPKKRVTTQGPLDR